MIRAFVPFLPFLRLFSFFLNFFSRTSHRAVTFSSQDQDLLQGKGFQEQVLGIAFFLCLIRCSMWGGDSVVAGVTSSAR